MAKKRGSLAKSRPATPGAKVLARVSKRSVARRAKPSAARRATKQPTRAKAAPPAKKPKPPTRAKGAQAFPKSKRALKAKGQPQVVGKPAPRPAAPSAPKRLSSTAAQPRIAAAAAQLGCSQLGLEQRRAIRAALEGRDSIVILPDDAQAVACYQVPALVLNQPTLVISPVSAELKAQREMLCERRVPAVCLLTEVTGPERSAALARIARGGPLLVLLSPELASAPDVERALAKSGVGLLVVEEAHCASGNSHELRPSYADLGVTLKSFGNPPKMALARVASRAVQSDISARLGLTSPVVIQAPPVPENLRIVTQLARGDSRQAALVRLIERLERPGLVLCATPHDVDSVYASVTGAGIPAQRYHSGMTPGDRATARRSFTLPGERSVMVALSAFAPGSGLPGLGDPAEAIAAGYGRGAGKRGLRFLVHYQSPASLEQYLREIQRAGADGKPATCVLLHESSHRSLHEVMLAQQRFKATHLAELARALEAPALESRSVALEALALATGQSRRTTDRLTALLADARVVSRSGGGVRVLCSASELSDACRKLGQQLYALREQDAERLAAVTAFAETSECKIAFLSRYLGQAESVACGRCSACSAELLAREVGIVSAQVPARRTVVQEFSVQSLSLPLSAVESNSEQGRAGPLTAKLADFEAAMPRASR